MPALLAPHDREAFAGMKICADLKDGKLTIEKLKAVHDKSARDPKKLERVNGVAHWAKVDLAQSSATGECPGCRAQK